MAVDDAVPGVAITSVGLADEAGLERPVASRSPAARSRSSSLASLTAPTSIIHRKEEIDMTCEACKQAIDETQARDGAVRMSECFWHLECFTCITCGRQVPLSQDNVLLVGTQPMCEDCTFHCCKCNQVIKDEVIMCDQDPYHTTCFCCSYCDTPIDTNVFAKAPGIIACTPCQNKIPYSSYSPRSPRSLESPLSEVPVSTSDHTETYSPHSVRRTSTSSTYSSLYSPKTTEQRSSLASRPATEELDWHRSSAITDSGSFEMAYDRLSEIIQMDIVQAYYGMQSRTETPIPGMLDDTAQPTSPTKELWNYPGSSTDSEILRSLSLYDSEFEALLATPDNLKRTSPSKQRQSERLSQASAQLVNNIAEAIARRSSSDQDQQSVDDSNKSFPTVARPDKDVLSESAAVTDLGLAEETEFSRKDAETNNESSDQLQRRINLAELLAIEDARAPQEDQTDDDRTIKSRVELVLHSLIAHLDVIKLEYASDTQKYIAQRECLRQELRPMLQMRAALHQENQRLASRADELNNLIEQLETHSRQIQTEKPLPNEDQRDGRQWANLQRSTTSERGSSRNQTPASREALSRAKTQIPATSSSTNARLDASLPPLPEPRRFRWIKPRLLSNQDLAALGESLLQPAFEIKRTPSTITPPVPPKSMQPSMGGSDSVHAQNHVFQITNVLRPSSRCFVCMRSVWGQSELRCQACQQVCHNDCIPYISSVCPVATSTPFTSQSGYPNSPQLTSESLETSRESMIGRSLIEQAKLENQLVPQLIERCVAAVERNGLEDEGLYRRNGGIQQQRVILQLFDSGRPFDLADLGIFNDVGAITSVLKYYLRELPDPLIPSEFHEAYLAFGERMTLAPRAVALSAMRRLLSQLPEPHHASLKRLCLHLKLVEQRSRKTRMSARNLGLVFGRTLKI